MNRLSDRVVIIRYERIKTAKIFGGFFYFYVGVDVMDAPPF